MRYIYIITISLILASCGPSSEEKKDIAAVTCSIMGETRDIDAAVRVEKMNDANPGQEELVYIGIPCGNKYMVWWKDADGKPTGQKLVKSGEVVAQLESWLGTMKGLDKTSSHGKEFWAHAIENSEPPKQKGKDEKDKAQKHDKATDFWVDK